MTFASFSLVKQNTLESIKPPPKLTVSEWADEYRYLSAESSAAPGRWKTSQAPYQKGMMDVLNDPRVKFAVLMCSAQIGKTEIINNTVGYFMDQDPSIMLLLQPTLEMANTWSKDRLAPMLRDTPCLRDKVKDARSRDSGNTLLHKQFPGGHITMAGANSPASLASRPIRIVLCDEVDRYPASAGTEGDPVALAFKRTTTFHNALGILTSTPTDGDSRINKAFLESDQRRFYVPCPHCEHRQTFKFDNLKWEQDKDDHVVLESVCYRCESCQNTFDDSHKAALLKQGQWIATNTFTGTAGFHINELYSPWVRWCDIVQKYLEVKDHPERYKTWVNTSLGEPFEEAIAEELKPEVLMARRESFGYKVPVGGVLTCGVDVQVDRLVVQTVAWTANSYESWVMDYRVIPGNPAENEVWERLDEYLLQGWSSIDGNTLRIGATFVDSGYQTQPVYRFTKTRASRHVFAVKGSSTYGTAIASLPKRQKNKTPVLLVSIGTDTAKNLLFSRLKITDSGPSYIHFPKRLDEQYFQELTAERCIEKNGKIRWEKKEEGAANEALDTYVYALAAIEYLKPNFRKKARKVVESEPEPSRLVFQRRPKERKPSTTFVEDW